MQGITNISSPIFLQFQPVITTGVLSIVIPAYNEAKRLPATLRWIHSYLNKSSLEYEIIAVDDGSSDFTPEVTLKAASALKGILSSRTKLTEAGVLVRKGVFYSTVQLVLGATCFTACAQPPRSESAHIEPLFSPMYTLLQIPSLSGTSASVHPHPPRDGLFFSPGPCDLLS